MNLTRLIFVTAATASLALACTKSKEEEAPVEVKGPTESQGFGNEPTVEALGGPRDTLVLAMQSDFGSLLSIAPEHGEDSYLLDNMQVLPLDWDLDCKLTYKPQLYESFSFNEDYTVFTAKVAKGYTWYDGKPVTAHDVKFTWDFLWDPKVASPRVAYVEHQQKGSPFVIDDHTLEFRFTRAYDQITMTAHASALALMAQQQLKGADTATLRGHEAAENPLTYGPWKIQKWERDKQLVLVPNEKFTGPAHMKPRLRRVIYKVVPEYATRLVELENGSVDWAQNILPADADRLRQSHPDIKIYRRGWRSQDYIGWNQFDPEDYAKKKKALKPGQSVDWNKVKPHPLWGDKRVRRALTKAIDVEKLMTDLLSSKVTGEKYAKRAVSTVTPSLCEAENRDVDTIPYDPKGARKELEALGWKDTDKDGILDKDGRKFSFTLSTNSGNPRRAKAAIIIQSNLKDVGIEMNIEKTEANTFFSRQRKKQFDAVLSGWLAGLFVDMSSIWHSGDKYEFNAVSYHNPKVDKLIDKALNEPDPKKNIPLWREVQRLIYEDQPYTFLYWQDGLVALHKRFKDARIDIGSTTRNLNRWWVPSHEVKYPR